MNEEAKATTAAVLVPRRTEGALDVGTVGEAMQLARVLCKSALVPKALQDREADTLLVMLTGRSIGINSVAALRTIYVVNGRPAFDASLLRALAMQHPECEYLMLVEDGSQGRATWETKRAGQPKPTRITWTLDDAKRAGLLGKDNWKNYPAAMLRARASADLVRAVYPEVGMGIYSREEIEDAADEMQPAVEDQVLRPAKAQAAPVEAKPMTAGQKGRIKTLTTHLGEDVVGQVKARLGLDGEPSEAQAFLLLDTLSSEAEARIAATKREVRPQDAAPDQGPPASGGEPAGDLWQQGRE